MNMGNRQKSNLERGGAGLHILDDQDGTIWKTCGLHYDPILTDPTGFISRLSVNKVLKFAITGLHPAGLIMAGTGNPRREP